MTEAAAFLTLYTIAFVAFPYLLLRGEARRNYLLFDIGSYVAAAVIYLIAAHAGVHIERDFGVALLIAAKLTGCCALFALEVSRQRLRDDATLLALFALVVQLILYIPAARIDMNGDERQYLVIAVSIAEDFDLDLRNQYAATGLGPELGDRTGANGELYSRLEWFLPLLLVPGYAIAGAAGAVATMFVFAFLFARALLVLLEHERISRSSRIIAFFFVAFGAPALFYSMRIWPEIPGAYFFTVALIEARRHNSRRMLVALTALSLLKLRFVTIALPLFLLTHSRVSGARRKIAIVLLLIALPLAGAFFATGDPTGVHATSEFALQSPALYAKGFFGLLLDGQQGLLFTAPLLAIGVLGVMGVRGVSPALKLGALAALPYLVLLLPRPEWHGGWSPPLRYITVFTPLLALAAATAIERVLAKAMILAAALGTAAFTIHGVVQPWRLFHIANGENAAGEYLSRLHASDFSRLFPSFIRLNDAAVIAAGVVTLLALALLLLRNRRVVIGSGAVTALAVLIALLGVEGRRAGRVVHLEDAHVQHRGGALYPHEYTVARFQYVAGWRFFPGTEATFLARHGPAKLYYRSDIPARVMIDGVAYALPVSNTPAAAGVTIARTGRVTLRCIDGSVIIDRLVHD